jgi:predicted transcriptional regulator
MFGRSLRLRVLIWVYRQDSPFYQSQVARGVNYSSESAVAKELATLESLQMVRRFGRPGKVGRLNFLRIDSPFWNVVEAVEEILRAAAEGELTEES